MKDPKKQIAIALRIDEPYPHHQLVFDGVMRYAKEQPGWRCLIDEHPGYKPAARGENYARYDGVIGRADDDMQRRLKRMGVPLVNTHYQFAKPGLPGVYADTFAIGRIAADHLIDRGFRRLRVLSDRHHKHAFDVGQAFIKRARQEDILDCRLLDLDESSTYDAASYWLKVEQQITESLNDLEPPVAVFVEAAQHARLLTQLIYDRGWSVPHDVAVLCFNNLRAVVDIHPQISSIEANYDRIGYQAARLLDRILSGEPALDLQVLVPPAGVIGRESTDYFAVEDPIVADALRYISSRLNQKLRIETIAYELAVSPSLLKSRFSAALGRGVGEEIRRLRLELAKRLLQDPSRLIADIASQTGFNSSDVMNQVFRRELGMTPRAYRQTLLGQDEANLAAPY